MPMLGKLALRNAKRSIKDYTIYLLSLTIIFSLLYAFDMMIFSKDILDLCEVLDKMVYVITVVSVIIVLVSAWLVHYMNNFMLQRRSRELGIYMSLGISNRAISRLFLGENVIIGSISFLISLVTGSFLYQIITVIIMHVFEVQYQAKVTFSINALLRTLLYVILIFAFSLIRSQWKLRKMTIYNLLYAEKKNETMMFYNTKWSWIISIISLIIGAYGVILNWNNFNNGDNVLELNKLGITLLCCIICIYGFYFSISSILVKLFIENKRLKYKNGIFLLIRSLSAKMNTMRITIGTLGMLLTFTLTAFSIGMLMKGFFDAQANLICPFDIAISSENTENDFGSYKDYIHENLQVKGELSYPIYRSGTKTIYNLLPFTFTRCDFKDDIVMKYSDYQKLRKLLNYSEVNLKDGCFLVQCTLGVKEVLDKEENFKVKLCGKTLKYQNCYLEDFGLWGINGDQYLIIVPDELVQTMEVRQTVYAANTKKKTTVDDYNNLNNYNKPYPIKSQSGTSYNILEDDINVKGDLLAKSRSDFTVFSFSLFYLGLVFICIAATILAVQQLSDSRYKFRYKILRNLGMEEGKIDQYILKQCLFYFGFPVLLPIPISILITYCITPMLESFITKNLLPATLITSIGLFLFVYFLYFIATFISYRKNVQE